ncbi:GPW/gp25 family protein [Amycolatopsis sp. OK19-0408]|uniref:GPW/gp25 family protein n=1 Tax=Amycolatopsis iheyensis TaxID=2945988 RepID=A0A9X2NHD6_9PSEU|nr:GPW/gp25 family protein [Amycolatopsis iheyensis]MCR6487827.1 GPW/gp25 family protein [Amycolatopsis iheyensis]
MSDSGIAFPVGFTPWGTIAVAERVRKVEQAMRLVLLTYPGERARRPDFGSRLRDFVFEPVTSGTAARLAAEVRRALGEWERRAEVLAVDVVPDEARPGLLHIVIGYRLAGADELRELELPFHALPEGGVS